MAQLVIAAAGAALGGFIAPGIVAFGMTGASLGWMAGSMLGSAFAPTQKSSGPQLSDLSVSTSAYGTPIPYVQGHPRIAGQIVWASTKREIATTQEAGKGGGGSEYTSYTYEVDLLILLTDNQIAGVARIWSNGELVYDGTVRGGLWSRMTQYTGGASQLPDPTYEAVVGTANAPAYRGRGSVFIESLQLGGGGQIPNLTFEIGTSSESDGETLLMLRGYEGVLKDSSKYNRTVTNSANPITIASSPSLFGNSVYGIATGSFQQLDINDSFLDVLGSDEWCIEGWHYPTGTGFAAGDMFSFHRFIAFRDAAGAFKIGNTYLGGTSYLLQSAAGAMPLNTWTHYAFVRDNTTDPVFTVLRLFINGVQVAAGGGIGKTDIVQPGAGFGRIIAWGATGYHANMHWMTRSAKYYSNFPVPTSPPPLFSPGGIYATTDAVLSTTVANICALSGLQPAQYSTTALASITRPVRSMAISSVSSARTVLDMLASSYHFEAVLSDKIYFRPRASTPAATLTFNELGVVIDSGSTPEPLPLTQANELEIPAQMALTYSNVDGDYQTDTQYSDRLLTGQESTSAMQVPLGFTSSEAKQIVDAMLLDKAVSALTTSVSLSLTRAALEPTDVVLLTGEDGSTYRMRIVKKAEASGVTTLECVQDDSTVFTQTGTTAGGTASQTTVLATPTTTLALLDVPLLRDVDNLPGHYVAVKGSAANWTSAGLYDSLDDLTYTPNTTISSQAVMGSCTTVLADWAGGNVFDEVSSVTVNVGAQQLASVTRDDILASQSTNAALIGSEVLQYRTATLMSAGVYTLSGFLRGQRGTDSTGHGASDRFIVLASGGLRFVPLQQGDLGRLRYYKAASAGQRLSAVTSQSLTPAGITLKPFAPVDARANRDTADTVLTWIRQTRLSTRIVGTLGISSPLGETAEAYEVEIYSAGHAALLRTLTSGTPSVTYTSAQQVTDFGSAPASLAVKIYQISATVGRGTPLITTV